MTVAPGVDITGVEIDEARSAYYNFVGVADRAATNPGQDWEPEIRKYAIDPAAADALQEISELAADSSQIVGHASFAATVTAASVSKIVLRICVDNHGQDFVDRATGQSVKDEIGGKHPQDATIVRDSSGAWFLQSIRGYPTSPC